MIKKLPNQSKWRIYSKKKLLIKGKMRYKNLGTFNSEQAAKKHEREIQFFKHRGK